MVGGFKSTKWDLPSNIDAAVDMVTRKLPMSLFQ